MNRETINARNAPAPRGGYSQAVKIEDFKTLLMSIGQLLQGHVRRLTTGQQGAQHQRHAEPANAGPHVRAEVLRLH